MSALTDADRAFLLLLIKVCLSVCVVWALWEMEEYRERGERERERERQSRPQAPAVVNRRTPPDR
jgi:hypothetical protein